MILFSYIILKALKSVCIVFLVLEIPKKNTCIFPSVPLCLLLTPGGDPCCSPLSPLSKWICRQALDRSSCVCSITVKTRSPTSSRAGVLTKASFCLVSVSFILPQSPIRSARSLDLQLYLELPRCGRLPRVSVNF